MPAPLRTLDQVVLGNTDRRRDVRTAGFATVSLGMAGKQPAEVKLTDVSLYGCCVETEAEWLRPGRFVAIHLPADPALQSIVRWTRDGLAGLELLRPAAADRPDWLALID